ncbi:MAG TPA: FliM/FliN family flagellar motor switch protein [Pyrinomonadaceae bacterium]|jgi:type III secretion system YscQ/HrcQ family protein
MESSSQAEENAVDPFAADIFAAGQKPGDEAAEQTAPPDLSWNRLLKRSAPAEIDWSGLLADLPPDFTAKVAARLSKALQNLLALPAENAVEFLPLVTKEINRAEDFPSFSNQSWWLGVAVEQSEFEFAVEFDNAFAIWLIDAAFGEKVSDRINLREPTETETAVLEFLSLNLIYEANQALQSPIFKFGSLVRQAPRWLADARKNFTEGDSFLAVNWQTIHGLLPSIVRIYLAPDVLKNLSASENPILRAARPRRTDWRRFENHTKDVRARLPLGKIELTLAELASIETGDVAMLENYDLNLFGGNLFGRAEIFLGDGENLKISGEILAPEAASAEAFEENAQTIDNKILARKLSANQAWKFVVIDLAEIENPPGFRQAMTETDENLSGENDSGTTGDGKGLAVENLALTLRVELEARRLTLAEIADLRENQILELGVRPTDAVNLLIENRVVGRGELVEIEERLGVRITKLLR